MSGYEPDLTRRHRIATHIGATLHEIRCRECRVTWRSWLARLLGFKIGYTPARMGGVPDREGTDHGQ